MKHRQNKIRNCFKEFKIDAFIVDDADKVRYFTGLHIMEKGEAICLITKRKCLVITNPIYEEQAKKEIKDANILIVKNKGPLSTAVDILKSNKSIKNIGIEDDISFQSTSIIKRDSGKKLILCHSLVDRISAVKDKNEISTIKKAVKLTERIFDEHIISLIRPGITENELAAWISFYGKKYGAENDAFQIIVASGKRSSLIHGRATNKKIRKNDIIQFDFGHIVNGYPSDFSRIVFVGKPTKKQEKIYWIVRTAQEMAIKVAKPGISCGELHAIASNHIKNRGYKLPHALGHGLGIKIHSAPIVRKESLVILEPGHVITIEPGIYIPGWGGIRIEDVIVITETGAKNLTSFSKDIIVV